MTERGLARTVARQNTAEAAAARDSTGEVMLHTGEPADTSRRLFIDVYDTEGAKLRDIPVPFGIADTGGPAAVVRFGVLVISRHHPELRVLEMREHTDTDNAAVLVADRGPL